MSMSMTPNQRRQSERRQSHRRQSHRRHSQRPVRRKTLPVFDGTTGNRKENDEFIQEYMAERGVPAWYRGTSQFQIEAADALLNAIRDDTEQRTAHRVRAILGQIGIEPTITVAETKLLMRLSRGNDLAFLWFLMELHYKTPGLDYSVNEQLIMSTICHLDMIPTMRELDRILPPSSLSKKKWLKRKSKEQQKPKPQFKTAKPQYVLPYFEKLVRPRCFGKPLSIPTPDFKVRLGFYENYKNPHHQVPNESNRWYTNYEMQTGKRIVRRILSEEISRMFEDFSTISLLADKQIVLCNHHRAIRELEETLKDELLVMARDRCNQYFDVNKHRQEERDARIRDMLEKDVRRYLCKFRKLAEKTKNQMVIMTIASECDCQYHLVDIKDEPCEARNDLPDQTDFEAAKEKRTSILTTASHIVQEKGSAEQTKVKEKGNNMPFGNGAMEDALDDITSGDSHEHMMDRRASKGRVSIVDNLVKVSTNMCGTVCSTRAMEAEDLREITPSPSEIFFEAPTDQKPYQFDYEKIFHFKATHQNELPVNRTIVQALDSEVSLPAKVSDSKVNVNDAVRNCAIKIWNLEVARKNAEMEAEEERKREELRNGVRSILNYDYEYYDPEDSVLMSRMIKDALEYMSKSPKFVLASLPESYKLPILREWMLTRYGKVYTKTERYRSFFKSTKIFQALDKVKLEVALPKQRKLGTRQVVDYSCRNYLVKKAEVAKQEYYHRLDAAVMAMSRVSWFAMRPYMCFNGPPRNSFYAYMPDRAKDILHFAIWKPSEYMNAKSEWESRMHKSGR